MLKVNLKYPRKKLEFNEKSENIEPKTGGKISWNNLPKFR